MSTTFWIVGSGLLMCGTAVWGGALFLLSDRMQKLILTPLVAFAAGSLVGAALFHLGPHAVLALGFARAALWSAVGFLLFLTSQAVFGRHHHHLEPAHDVHEPDPVVWRLLAADALHSLLAGLAISGAFLADIRLGITVWLAEAAHEIPQEISEMAVLVRGGLSRRDALVYNVASSLAYPLGGLIALGVAGRVDFAFLFAVSTGTFLYLALVDLLPDLLHAKDRVINLGAVGAGILVLLALKYVLEPPGQ